MVDNSAEAEIATDSVIKNESAGISILVFIFPSENGNVP
jgi:hypothetical protein